ncbi:hypothetical protein Ancab_005259 [Ancistrocladus abbreviatus]
MVRQTLRQTLQQLKGKFSFPQNNVKSIFFTNYLKDWSMMSMWKVFWRHGRVIDIFCPSKADRSGKRFGFVRYIEVNNIIELVQSLDGVWIGSFKLQVRVAIERQKNLGPVGKEFGRRGSKWGMKDSSHPSFVGFGSSSSSTKDGRTQPSYADIVKASNSAKVGTMQPSVVHRSTRQKEGDESNESLFIQVYNVDGHGISSGVSGSERGVPSSPSASPAQTHGDVSKIQTITPAPISSKQRQLTEDLNGEATKIEATEGSVGSSSKAIAERAGGDEECAGRSNHINDKNCLFDDKAGVGSYLTNHGLNVTGKE